MWRRNRQDGGVRALPIQNRYNRRHLPRQWVRVSSFQQGFDLVLEGGASSFVRRNDENGVISRDGASNFRKFRRIHGGSEGLRATGRRFENEKILSRTNVKQELAKRTGERWKRSGLFRKSRLLLVAFASLYELELLKVPGKCGLGHAEALLREAPAEVVLASDAFSGDKPEDLTLAKCFACAHESNIIHLTV